MRQLALHSRLGLKEQLDEKPTSPSKCIKTTLLGLTLNFLELVESRPDFHLDEFTATMACPKRRLYDLINIFQGLGLVERASKSRYRWVGLAGVALPDSRECDGKSLAQLTRLIATKIIQGKTFQQASQEQLQACRADRAEEKSVRRRIYDIVNPGLRQRRKAPILSKEDLLRMPAGKLGELVKSLLRGPYGNQIAEHIVVRGNQFQ